ncbi:PTS sugar transporter subunit IIC [Schleiferilactobacillus harbinensis]|jgi:PTS system cellobiose-specific IIC component|uniref:PTS sugar transporter subunit IIC n=1 Tax=Schleiferilactobacillus harbinensis TaxID=304207 RepID=UPI00116A24D4|nr:PTS transporter subunit EIIC [Schleiferilactobacillus harbinensis]MBO3092700.1 PTS sugar transporter subunit IIC [Schleiferilactobacillus harbinensis]GEK07653.1 permease IIC component [Schleiferilactobacillus harbinensis]
MAEEKSHAGLHKFMDKFAEVSGKVGNQVHLRSLRDAFAVIMPLFILAGVGVLINNVVFPLIAKGQTLANLQVWGNLISNGTLNIAGLALAPTIGYVLARNKGYDNPISAAMIALSSLIVTMPITVQMIPTGAKRAVDITGALSFANLGTTGMFSGIIIGLLATTLFIKLAAVKHLQINMGDSIPPMVSRSFSSMIPAILTVSTFAVGAALLSVFGHTNLIAIITAVIQEPLRRFNTSLPGMLFIYSVGNFLFTLGIHQTVINGTLLDPLLLINMNKNMVAYNAHKSIPYILTNTFRDTFGMIGGTGSTLCLLIAIFVFSKLKSSRDIASLAVAPGIFNINEPVIFGFPIVFNLPMMVPFVLQPVIGILIAYAATVLGWMNRVVVLIPWTTPPFLSAFLATGGDWRAVIVQLLIIVEGVFFYLPFLMVSDRVTKRNAELERAQ